MTIELSRRQLVTLAGVGLAASACRLGGAGGNEQTKERIIGNDARPYADILPNFYSKCEDWGVPPGTLSKDKTKFPLQFNAPYICVILINFSEAWRMKINYASFYMNNDFSDQERLNKARAILQEKFGLTSRPAVDHLSDLVDNPTCNRSDHRNFSKFGFKSKHELFFFFESPKVLLDQKTLAVFTEANTKKPTDPHHLNFSFVNALEVTRSEMGANLYAKGRMFRMRNYVQDEIGQPIDASKNQSRHYGMNIHFSLQGEGSDWVPLVIDPDTGNGAGHEP